MRPRPGHTTGRMLVGLVFGLVGLGAVGTTSRGDFFRFDPDGGGGSLSPSTIGGFDFSVGNSLARGGVTAINQKLADPTSSPTFQLYYQATLAGVISTGGSTSIPNGLNSTFEITVVASVTEVVTSAVSGLATFAVAPVQSAGSFLRVYYGSTVDASNLNGTGFNNGTLILEALPFTSLGTTGNFMRNLQPNGQPVTQVYDQRGDNDYPGISTVVGNGASVILSNITFAHPDFFPDPVLPPDISFNATNVTPFIQGQPSAQFTGLSGGSFVTISPNLGTVNGQSGPDFQFQSDGNAFIVPEPSSAILTGLGLVGLLVLTRRVRPGV